MSNVVRFVPKSELERQRLIREARAARRGASSFTSTTWRMPACT
ncbi:hypothetical protein RAD16_35595 [Bradyrhizobium sp. 18BD]